MGLKVSQNINDKNNKLYGSNFPLKIEFSGSTEGIVEMVFNPPQECNQSFCLRTDVLSAWVEYNLRI